MSVDVIKIAKFRLLVARALNALYYKTGVKVFREISNKLALGIPVRVNDIWYIFTCVSDLFGACS
jgi:hypothetical protein